MYPQVWNGWVIGRPILNFLRNLHTDFHSGREDSCLSRREWCPTWAGCSSLLRTTTVQSPRLGPPCQDRQKAPGGVEGMARSHSAATRWGRRAGSSASRKGWHLLQRETGQLGHGSHQELQLDSVPGWGGALRQRLLLVTQSKQLDLVP